MRYGAYVMGRNKSAGAGANHAANAKHGVKSRHGRFTEPFFDLDRLRIHGNVHGSCCSAKSKECGGKSCGIHCKTRKHQTEAESNTADNSDFPAAKPVYELTGKRN